MLHGFFVLAHLRPQTYCWTPPPSSCPLSKLPQCGGDAVVFDYFDDPNIQRRGRMDMLQLKEYSEIKRITLMGARYAAKLEAEGAFDKFHLEPVLKR